jgi:hypothetical protein
MNGPLQWVLLAFFVGPLVGLAQDSKSTVEILEAETAEHRIGDRRPIYTNLGHDDGVSKSVLDYVGRDAGMPAGVSDVEAAIDRLSGASTWIGRK